MSPDPSRADPANAGFTLIETVVALAVVAVVAGAIAALSSSNRRAIAASIDRIQTTLAARGAAIELDSRRDAGAGPTNGRSDAYAWSYVSTPLESGRENAGSALWTPYQVRIQVEGPGGARVMVNAIRLRRIGQ